MNAKRLAKKLNKWLWKNWFKVDGKNKGTIILSRNYLHNFDLLSLPIEAWRSQPPISAEDKPPAIITTGPLKYIQAGIPWISINNDSNKPELYVKYLVRYEYKGAPDSDKIHLNYIVGHLDDDGWHDGHHEIHLMEGTVTHYARITEPDG
jgi:hypothetical protein